MGGTDFSIPFQPPTPYSFSMPPGIGIPGMGMSGAGMPGAGMPNFGTQSSTGMPTNSPQNQNVQASQMQPLSQTYRNLRKEVPYTTLSAPIFKELWKEQTDPNYKLPAQGTQPFGGGMQGLMSHMIWNNWRSQIIQEKETNKKGKK